MKYLLAGLLVWGSLSAVPSAMAQYVTTYYAPTQVFVARPVYAPITTYYAPGPAYYAAVPTVTYRPAVAAYSYRAPVVAYPTPVAVYRAPISVAPVPAGVVYGRPVYTYYSPYGGTEIRVPGRPIRNFVRAVVP